MTSKVLYIFPHNLIKKTFHNVKMNNILLNWDVDKIRNEINKEDNITTLYLYFISNVYSDLYSLVPIIYNNNDDYGKLGGMCGIRRFLYKIFNDPHIKMPEKIKVCLFAWKVDDDPFNIQNKNTDYYTFPQNNIKIEEFYFRGKGKDYSSMLKWLSFTLLQFCCNNNNNDDDEIIKKIFDKSSNPYYENFNNDNLLLKRKFTSRFLLDK